MEVQEETQQTTRSNNQTMRQALQIAILCSLFFIIGIGVGAYGYDQLITSQRDLVEEVIATQIADQDARIADQVVNTLLQGVQAGQPRQQPPAPGEGPRRDVSVDDDPSIGAPDAPIVIIEFSDFQCPYCGRFALNTLEPLLGEYGEYIHFVYRDFIVRGEESVKAAAAAECADDQESFWAYHDLIFENQENLNREAYISFAEQLELDIEAFTECVDSGRYLEEVMSDSTEAQRLGVTGTPTFYINGRYVSGAQPLDVFVRIIEEELAEAGIERG